MVLEAFLWCRGVLMCVLGALGDVGSARGCFGCCLKGGVGAFGGRFMGCWERLGVLGAFWDITIQVRCLMKYR